MLAIFHGNVIYVPKKYNIILLFPVEIKTMPLTIIRKPNDRKNYALLPLTINQFDSITI